ncbi:hypothetical protein CANTEDRAFT_116046 [Yamadazyma tenuis ATCC 10573]|uniref:Uncharacterized protein n=2 Tax=Candida tenuis TaxID=2315449 RepID=G3BFC7_CANTC|nr:uncharacterized protein CANTEDRAFT_116046 [Yamadazyma tenuis ATCC 10573]EGV60026.1 hypothetical protein CANTEDRAFT_116046 [Yamadazyma tenuis ATCC 10573]
MRLAPRDSVEFVLGGEDIAKAAKYARYKIPEVAHEWKDSFKTKLANKLLNTGKNEPDIAQKHTIINSDLIELLEDGQYRLIKQNGDVQVGDMEDEPPRRPRPKSLKTNPKDLGIKNHQAFKQKTTYQDPFEA